METININFGGAPEHLTIDICKTTKIVYEGINSTLIATQAQCTTDLVRGAQPSYLTPLNIKGKMHCCPAAGPDVATHDDGGDKPGHTGVVSCAPAWHLLQFLAHPRDVKHPQLRQKSSVLHF